MFSKLTSIFTILICVVVIDLWINNDLRLYIHPRYEIFTIVLVVFGLIMLVISYLNKIFPSKGSMLVIFAGLLCIILPATTLSDGLASGRLSKPKGNFEVTQSTIDSFSNDLTRFDIRDWQRYFASSPTPNMVVGKSANVEGFLFTIDSQFFIGRYQLTCCAVDATPISIALYSNEELKQYKNGDWLRVKGQIVYIENSNFQYQLDPYEINLIEEPEQPYVY